MEKELMAKLALDHILGGAANQEDATIFATSITEANRLYKQHMIRPDGAQYRRELIDYICTPSNNVLGDADEYHNLLMDIFRIGDYFSGMKLCQYALTFYPHNCDLLGDGIKAAADGGDFELAESLFRIADSIDKSRWNFRLFLYSVDYYKTKYKADPTQQAVIDKAKSLADEYVKYFPYDEHGYNQQAELLLLENKRDEAIDLLHHYIFDPLDSKNASTSLITAQCCTTLLQILDDSNNYNLIIKTARRGIRNSKTVQLSASVGYFAYRWALALDAMCADEDYEKESRIEEALRKYQAAYNIANDLDFSSVIEQNYSFLRSFVLGKERDPGPLVKYRLYIDKTDDAD